jgi:sugar lactone lactonase YvrE
MLTETTLDAEPFGVAVDPDGDVWITEEYANAVVCRRPDGTLITVAAPTRHAQPYGIALAPGRTLVFTERNANSIGIIRY